jgi:hypothetical protein
VITDGPNGTGIDLCNPANYPSYSLGEINTFYGGQYNFTAGFLGDVISSATWTSNDPGVVDVSSPGNSSQITCDDSSGGVATITLDAGGGFTNTTQVTVLSATIDNIQIRDAPTGGGTDLSDPGNFPNYPVGYGTTFYAASYNGTTFLSDVPVSWSSSDDTLVGVTPLGSFTSITCSINESGLVTVTADYGGGIFTTTLVTVLQPTVDYVQIRTESQGNGIDLGNPTNYLGFPVGSSSTLYSAIYNNTAGFLNETPVTSLWSSQDDSIISVISQGTSSQLTCSDTNYGNVTITLDDGEGHSNSTQVTVLEPIVDYIQIRNASGGGGVVPESLHYWIGEIDMDYFYCAAYNDTAGYIGERFADWSLSEDVGTIGIPSGNFTIFTPVSPGYAHLIASFNGLSFSIDIVVEEIHDDPYMFSPTGFSVDLVEDGGALQLSWDQYNWSQEVGFRIFRSSDGGLNFQLLNPGDLVSGTSYRDFHLTNGRTYHYYIVAVDNSSNTSPSSAIRFNTPIGDEEPVDEDEPEFPGWILLLLIIIIVVVLLLFILFGRRKKEEPARTFEELDKEEPIVGDAEMKIENPQVEEEIPNEKEVPPEEDESLVLDDPEEDINQ